MITKQELVEILNSLKIPINEGIQNDNNTDVCPRVVYWEFRWDPITASNKNYNTNVTYQISFFASAPRNEKLLALKNKLEEKGIHPGIEHEYLEDKRQMHSFFAIEVLENV